MRSMISGAVEQARDLVGQVVVEVRDESALTPREGLERYVREHKDKPWALLRFVQATAPPEIDHITSAIEYEAAMERQIREQKREV